jgi:DNA-binding beta-propeller fold protein YncE
MKNLTVFTVSLLANVIIANAQNLLNKPEHVAYDAANQRYLVTNYGNGKIISIDQAENQEVIIEGLTGCLGIHIVDTTIFVSAGTNIYLFGLNTHTPLDTITPEVSNWLDGMIDDGEGYLYAVENSGKIHRVNLADKSCEVIVNGGLPAYPQDLAFDSENNRLIVACWEVSSSIISIDLNSNQISNLLPTSSGQYDGIVMDGQKSIYVTSWLNSGRVYKWSFPYNDEPEIISQEHAGPAGLCYDLEHNLLVVPNFNGNSISYITLSQTTAEIINRKPKIEIKGSYVSGICYEKTEISITNLLGRKIYNQCFANQEIRIDLGETLNRHGTGLYIVSIYSGNDFYSLKYSIL